MNLLAWNCRRLGNPQTVQVFAQRWDPKIIFLSETKLKKRNMEKEKEKAGFKNGLIILCIGRSGGLVLLWKKDILVEVQGYLNHYIDAIVTDSSSGFI